MSARRQFTYPADLLPSIYAVALTDAVLDGGMPDHPPSVQLRAQWIRFVRLLRMAPGPPGAELDLTALSHARLRGFFGDLTSMLWCWKGLSPRERRACLEAVWAETTPDADEAPTAAPPPAPASAEEKKPG
jgi:hypothetical protein